MLLYPPKFGRNCHAMLMKGIFTSSVDEEEYLVNENGKLRIHRVVTWHYVRKKLTIPQRLRSSFVLVVVANFLKSLFHTFTFIDQPLMCINISPI